MTFNMLLFLGSIIIYFLSAKLNYKAQKAIERNRILLNEVGELHKKIDQSMINYCDIILVSLRESTDQNGVH